MIHISPKKLYLLASSFTTQSSYKERFVSLQRRFLFICIFVLGACNRVCVETPAIALSNDVNMVSATSREQECAGIASNVICAIVKAPDDWRELHPLRFLQMELRTSRAQSESSQIAASYLKSSDAIWIDIPGTDIRMAICGGKLRPFFQDGSCLECWYVPEIAEMLEGAGQMWFKDYEIEISSPRLNSSNLCLRFGSGEIVRSSMHMAYRKKLPEQETREDKLLADVGRIDMLIRFESPAVDLAISDGKLNPFLINRANNTLLRTVDIDGTYSNHWVNRDTYEYLFNAQLGALPAVFHVRVKNRCIVFGTRLTSGSGITVDFSTVEHPIARIHAPLDLL